MTDTRQTEIDKYHRAYQLENYRMGVSRRLDAEAALAPIEPRLSYLDVGCGRGEMLDYATRLGYRRVRGVEVVPELIDGERVVAAQGHALPFADNEFQVVTMFDVIEHLLPGDDAAVCRELARVAGKHVILTANNRPSHLPDGTDLHINIRDYAEWDRLFRAWFAPGEVMWVGSQHYVSETWRIDF